MEKKLLLLVSIFTLGFASAQTKFGVKAGLTSQTITYEFAGVSISGSDTGFFVGGFADIGLSDKLHFQPELDYIAVTGNNSIEVPLLFKYAIIDKLFAMAGPGVNFSLDAPTDELTVAFDLGASYDLTDKFVVDLRYDLGLTGIKTSGIYAAFGYKF